MWCSTVRGWMYSASAIDRLLLACPVRQDLELTAGQTFQRRVDLDVWGRGELGHHYRVKHCPTDRNVLNGSHQVTRGVERLLQQVGRACGVFLEELLHVLS
ncbi:MAG: hypothetical protein VB860_09300, partial [Dehalococcoidia bacterium]